MDPLTRHRLDQYLAYSLETQASLRAYRDNLIEAGYTPAEAWALMQLVEERLLAPEIHRFTEGPAAE